MFQIRTKLIAIGVALALLAGGYVAVGAFAEQGATPWPDPGQGHGPAVAGQELEGTETPEATETPEDAGTVDPLQTPDGGLGVPTDSPACVRTPNPHDTDDDGDGCREVETDDGMKNLPDPAADAHEGDPGHIGDLHGRPEGDPPYGNAVGHPTPTPTATPTG